MPADTSSPSNASPGRLGNDERWLARSKLYDTVMTPINFVVFLVSLYLVDCGYEDERVRRHAAGRRPAATAWPLPGWLHRLFFTPRPYEWVADQGGPDRPAPPNRKEERYYYHSKQRKLMKMEAADAFSLRGPVLVALAVLGVALAWGTLRLGALLLFRVVGGA